MEVAQSNHEIPDHKPITQGRILGLALPVIGENLLETLLGTVDTLLVAGVGTAALAGVGNGLQIMFFLLSALSALSVGSSILVAQAVGAADPVRAGLLARQSLVWSLILSLPLALGGFATAHPLMALFGTTPEVTRIGVAYVQVTMATVVVVVALIIGGGVLRGAGDSRTPMIVTGIANVLNGFLAYALIFGRWGLPALGAVGSAWATFIARGLALVLLLIAMWQGRNGVRISGRTGWKPEWSTARRVLALGLPASAEQVLLAAAFMMLTVLVAHLGTSTLAALRISITALSLSFLPGAGFSIAATALVGQCIGAKRPDDASAVARIATLWAVIWMGTIGLVIFVFATPIMHMFTREPDVVRIGAGGLRVVALIQPAWAIWGVQAGALRGTGDTRFPLIAGAVCTWSAVLIVWIGLRIIGGGLPMVWSAFMITSPIGAAVTWRRFRARMRIQKREQSLFQPEQEAEAAEITPAAPQ